MYNRKNLTEKIVAADPFSQFTLWYTERLNSGVSIPDAVTLGTESAKGGVSLRMVLMKDYDEKGFAFFTNFNSRKGKN